MKKILVVDDDVDILTMVKMTLSIHKFNVNAISRWQDIHDNIERFNPDLILLDISLGGADGREICKALKQSPKTQHIPVILFSANPDQGKNFQDFQAQAFIAKPYELSELLQTLRVYLN